MALRAQGHNSEFRGIKSLRKVYGKGAREIVTIVARGRRDVDDRLGANLPYEAFAESGSVDISDLAGHIMLFC